MIKSYILLSLGVVMANADACKGDSAWKCLMKARDLLNNKYDYQGAITCFSRASDLCLSSTPTMSETTKQQQAQAWIGLAMSHHNIGQFSLRNLYMNKAKELLNLPDNVTGLTDATQYSSAVVEYFTVKGYQFYIQYEQSKKNGDEPVQQEIYLHQAKNSFLKSLEIARTLNNNIFDSSHAQHGLGTVFEFLGKCAQARHDWQQATQYAHQSIDTFKTALNIRTQSLGAYHPHVARSHHKVARNYALLTDLLNQQRGGDREKQKKLRSLANSHYQDALHIFEKNNIPLEHPKRKELIDEYELFKKNNMVS